MGVRKGADHSSFRSYRQCTITDEGFSRCITTALGVFAAAHEHFNDRVFDRLAFAFLGEEFL
ncbi:hypothetical protein CKJ84_10915 [Corynebacterium sp. NML 120412]|nr:hypothetical protein CKJ84_10915 [Corynebacterium sp. NML 120412]